jgi:tyrosyl-tRNA synthetase
LRSRAEVEADFLAYADNPNELKRLLAEELTIRIHSAKAYTSAKRVSELLFGKNADRAHLLSLELGELKTVGEEIPHKVVPAEVFGAGLPLDVLLCEHTDIVDTKANLRRAVSGNALSVNKEKMGSHDQSVSRDSLLHGQYLLVENGKKNKYLIDVR